MNLKEIGEFDLIDRFKAIVDSSSEELVVGIDDDAAAFKASEDLLTLVSTDALVEGVHFDLDYFSFYQLGWRSLAVNLSDIAAMAGVPKYAVVSLALASQLTAKSVDDFYRGMKELGDRFQTSIVGGDTTESPDRIFISVTVIGEVEEKKLTRRSGAKVGDSIFVTGSLGGSRAGLEILKSGNNELNTNYRPLVEKHLTPDPRVHEARFLVENFPIHAMIDLSDGLASDLHHICKQSKVGASICEERIAIESETTEVAELFHEKTLDYALNGGEDFELLFTVPSGVGDELSQRFRQQFGYNCHKIGTVTDTRGTVLLELKNGSQKQIHPERGYHHFIS